MKNKKINSIDSETEESKNFYTEYATGSNTLRVWFVTFGIGGLYLLLTTKDLLEKLQKEGELKMVAVLFLTGMGTQLLIAIINKWVNWLNYFYSVNKKSRIAKFVDWFSEQFWVDILCDIITCICFGKLIWMMINIFSK